MKKFNLFILLGATVALLSSCGSDGETYSREVKFTYENEEHIESASETEKLADSLNKSYDYDSLIVNPLDKALRDDFACGVDASMIHELEECGAKYYNNDGYKQDIFSLLKLGGCNYFRVRLWNDPTYYGITYGGGANTVDVDIELAKRAQEVGMNVLVDFHYSDFWADPDYQIAPKEWKSYSFDEVVNAVNTFTKESLQAFKDAGVTVNAVQIGNEINNGLIGEFGKIDWADTTESFQRVSRLLTSGINGAKSVFEDVYTIIHLANGGSWDEYEVYFAKLAENNVPYDIIGVSYYPYYHGGIDLLKENLENCVATFNKPVMVMETSYGNTIDSSNVWVGNTYNASCEDTGNYITGVQGQTTSLRDIVNVVNNIENNMGLGVFYWEPTWLPLAPTTVSGYDMITEHSAGWATEYGLCYKNFNNNSNLLSQIKANSDNNINKSTWANQGWFDYNGKALPSLYGFKILKDGEMNATEEKPLYFRDGTISYTLNRADENDLGPTTVRCVTNLQAIREYDVVWEQSIAELKKRDGVTRGIRGYITTSFATESGEPSQGNNYVSLDLTVIENFVQDSGFENQGTTDDLIAPWNIYSSSPSDQKVIKLNRKPTDVRTGTTDLNWYYGPKKSSWNIGQEIELSNTGNYKLTTYIMGSSTDSFEVESLDLYVTINGETKTVSALGALKGWSNGYQAVTLEFEVASAGKIIIGLEAKGVQAQGWGHVDDFELVKI